MFTTTIIFAVALTGCFANFPANTATKVVCGEVPDELIFSCLNYPTVVSEEISKKCSEPNSFTCIFREAGWLDGETISKKKMSEYFDKFAAEKPIYAAAVTALKTACLSKDLPPQTNSLDSPKYDIMHCITTSVVKNMAPSLWKTDEKCIYARAFVNSCPICPAECYNKLVPIGSCNACNAA